MRIIIASLLLLSLTGCPYTDPTVNTDQQQITDLKTQISDLQVKQKATTKPSDQSAIAAQILILQNQQAAAQLKLTNDSNAANAAASAATLAKLQATNAVVQTVAPAAGPWGAIAAVVSTMVVGVAGVYFSNKSSQTHAEASIQTSDNHAASIANINSTMQQMVKSLDTSVPAPPVILQTTSTPNLANLISK